MSDTVFGTILDFGRNDVKLEVRKRVIATRPEILAMMSNKLIQETHIYMQGYVDALKENIAEPYNRKEIQSFIYDRAYDYIVEKIDSLK